MLLHIHPDNPEYRKIKQVIPILKAGGVMIYLTDGVYAFGCDAFAPKAIEKLCRLRKLDPKKAMLTLLCKDISQISSLTKPLSNTTFRHIRQHAPGPYTFILQSNNAVPKIFKNKRRTLGVRIPEHPVAQALLDELGGPIVTSSVIQPDDIQEYYTDPEVIASIYIKQVEVIIDSGPGGIQPSTVVDCTVDPPELIREGAGEW